MPAHHSSGDRRLLVIASQCEAFGEDLHLSALEVTAKVLHAAMLDPLKGACEPALPEREDRCLVLNPSAEEAKNVLSAAYKRTAADRARLVLSILGHGDFDEDGAFYFLLADSPLKEHDPEFDVALNLVERLRKARGAYEGLTGLIVLVDACYSGVALDEAVDRLVARRPADWGCELITASGDRPAWDACFTKTVAATIDGGMKGRYAENIYCRDAQAAAHTTCTKQRSRRLNVDDVGTDLWLAKNVALTPTRAPWLSTEVSGEIERLTAHFQPVPELSQLVARLGSESPLALVGDAGTGKSALVAALARPDRAPGVVREGLLDAIAFVGAATTPEGLSDLLASQLATRLEGLPAFEKALERRTPPDEWASLTAIEQRVVRPLVDFSPERPVVVAIDGLDRIPEGVRPAIQEAISALGRCAHIRLVVSARRGYWLPPDASVIGLSSAPPKTIARFLAEASPAIETAQAERLGAASEGNWLLARLMAEIPAIDEAALPAGQDAVSSRYDALLDDLIARGLDWDAQLRPLLTVLAAAGSGAVLPIDLLQYAVGRLGPGDLSGLQEVLSRAQPVLARGQPGTPDERLGLFHQSLVDYLADASGAHPVDVDAGHRAILEAIGALAAADVAAVTPCARYALATEAEHLWALGQYERATEARRARKFATPKENLEAWQQWLGRAAAILNPTHPAVLAARHGVAYWTGESGDPARGRELCRGLLDNFERAIGSEDVGTLTLRRNLVHFTDLAGSSKGAAELAAPLLKDCQRAIGPEDRLTLVVQGDLASSLGDAGQPAAARDLLADIVAIRTRVLGSTHPDVLDGRAEHARFVAEAGEPAAARDAFEVLVHDNERVRGADHPETLRARANLAVSTGDGGEPAAARDAFEVLVQDFERVLGADHPDTLTARAQHARFVAEAGEPAAACDAFEVLVHDNERVLGADHPDTLTARANLAASTGDGGEPAAARDAFEVLVQDFERVLGADHPFTLTARAEHARFVAEAGETAAARDAFEVLVHDNERVLGADHPDTLTARANLAASTGDGGEPAAARDAFEVLVQDFERVLGADHPKTLTARAEHARFVAEAGETAAARDAFEVLVQDFERVLGADHPFTLTARANLAAWTHR